jgi:hypothetical protein
VEGDLRTISSSGFRLIDQRLVGRDSRRRGDRGMDGAGSASAPTATTPSPKPCRNSNVANFCFNSPKKRKSSRSTSFALVSWSYPIARSDSFDVHWHLFVSLTVDNQKPRHAAFKVQELGCGFPIGPDARQQRKRCNIAPMLREPGFCALSERTANPPIFSAVPSSTGRVCYQKVSCQQPCFAS